jgi:UDP-N-acetylmuramoylalanine--D-glutamate ligase
LELNVEEFAGKRISVIGAARSGTDAARILTLLGADVLLSDSQSASKLGAGRVAEIEATGAQWAVGADAGTALPDRTELVITSPGVPKSAAVLQAAVACGIPVWSEIELANRLSRVPIAAITGTNGKTTTTLLLAAMLRAGGIEAHIAGNVSADEIKRTLVDAAYTQTSGILVAEISSFQLEWVERFRPHVGILTNITPDHLNRHADFAEYAATKARLFAAQTPDDWALLNADSPAAHEIAAGSLPGRAVEFSRTRLPSGSAPAVWIDSGVAFLRAGAGEAAQALFQICDMPPSLPGAHSVENALAAGAAARLLGATPTAIAAGLSEFGGVAHRMEWVADIEGVRYINNSMCTNVAAGISSLLALDRPGIVIAGGADKALDFAPMTATLLAKARRLILIGAAADKMETTFRAGGYAAIERAPTLEAAVNRAQQLAEPGETVLLSPTCASFDMFTDFEARGVAFRRAVNALKETAA